MILFKLIRDYKPDIFHTHTSKAGLVGRLLVRLAWPKAKLVHTFHGHLLVGYFNKRYLYVIKFVERFLATFTSYLVTMGTQVKVDLVNAKIAPESKFKIFFPGLVHPKKIEKLTARRLLNFKEESINGVS